MKEIRIKNAIEILQKANVVLLEHIRKLKEVEDIDYVKKNKCEYYDVMENCVNEFDACELAIKSMQKIEKITSLKEGFYYIRDGKIHLCDEKWSIDELETMYLTEYEEDTVEEPTGDEVQDFLQWCRKNFTHVN